MKLITKSYYRNSKLFFYAGLIYAISVPSCIILWKNYNLEKLTDGLVLQMQRMNQSGQKITDIPKSQTPPQKLYNVPI